MLSKLEIHSPIPAIPLLSLSLGDGGANADLIQIRNIDGLGPVKANVNTTPFGSIDGEYYTGSSVGKRNIVLTLGLNPNWDDQSISGLRQSLYNYFMPKMPVKLRFFSDTMPTVEIEGYVESLEPNIFSKDPELQVSVICPQPDFVSTTPTVVTGVVFPSGVPADSDLTRINYLGNVPTGFVLQVKGNSSHSTYSGVLGVATTEPAPQAFVSTAVLIDTSQYFELSTVVGKKYVSAVNISGGPRTNLLRTMPPLTGWPQLQQGLNKFFVNADVAGQGWTMTYFARYGGL